MKKLLFIPLLIAFSGCADQRPGLANYWLDWSDSMLTQWQVKSTVLYANTIAYCSDSVQLPQLQIEWKALARHWAALNNFPYKAIADNNLEFDLYFWPDKRNTVEQKLKQRIQSQESLRLEDMANTVAAEKGLPAMEWLLFHDELTPEQRCQALEIITEYYSQQVDSIVQYHQDNPIIQDEWLEDAGSVEGASISLNLTFQQISHVSNQLRNGLNEQGQTIPVLTEGWRSNLSKDIYHTSLSSLIGHLEAALAQLRLGEKNSTLLKEVISDMKAQEASLESSTDIDPALMLEIQATLVYAEQIIEGPLAEETGVLIGFNNYDGD